MKKKKTIFIIWGILLAVILGICVVIFMKVSKLNDYKTQVSLGDKYLQEMDYENAELCYLQAISINAKKAKPYIQLSNIYVKQQRFDEAEDILYQALEAVESQSRNSINQQLDYVLAEKTLQMAEAAAVTTPTPTVEPTVEATPIPTEAPQAVTPEPTVEATPVPTQAPSILNDKESVRQKVIAHYTEIWQPDGTYDAFESEDVETETEYQFILRYQISDEAAQKKIAAGGTVSPNTLVTAVWVNKQTGEVTDEYSDTSWYIQ